MSEITNIIIIEDRDTYFEMFFFLRTVIYPTLVLKAYDSFSRHIPLPLDEWVREVSTATNN